MAFLDELKRRLLQEQPQPAPDKFVRAPQPTMADRAMGQAVEVAPSGTGQVLTPNNQAAVTRPRLAMDGVRRAVSQPAPAMVQEQMPSQGQMVQQAEPPDEIESQMARLQELESKPVGFWKRLGTGLLSRALTRRGDPTPVEITKRDRDIGRARRDLERSVAMERVRPDRNEQLSSRIVMEGEYPNLPAGAKVQTRMNRRTRQLEDVMQNGRPVIADLPNPEKENEGSLRTEGGYLLRVRGNKATKVLGEDGQPVKAKEDDKGEYTVTINGQTVPNVTRKELLQYYSQQESREGVESRFERSQEGIEDRFQRALEARNNEGETTDKTSLRKAAELAGQIEQVKKELEKWDSENLGPDASGKRAPAMELERKAIADKAAAAVTELNNLNAGYKAGMNGAGGYPYQEKVEGAAPSDLDKPIYGTPKKGTGKYAGQVITRAKLPEAAKRLGMTVNQARKYLTGEGATVK